MLGQLPKENDIANQALKLAQEILDSRKDSDKKCETMIDTYEEIIDKQDEMIKIYQLYVEKLTKCFNLCNCPHKYLMVDENGNLKIDRDKIK